ncbi:MAG: hypothetical protein ACRBCI_03485 [Cellvibrionaceae bacterium]
MTIKSYIFSFFLSLVLIGCGGGGGSSNPSTPKPDVYSGATGRATVEAANSQALSKGAVEATYNLTNYGQSTVDPQDFLRQASVDRSISSISLVDMGQQVLISELKADLSSQQNTANRIDETGSCSFGGKVRVIFPDISENATTVPQKGRGTLIFTGCEELEGTIDGIMAFSWNGFNENTIEFDNFTATFNLLLTETGGSSATVRGKMSCTNFGLDCTVSEDFVGANSVEYRVENIITSISIGGYSLEARVYHEGFGYVDIEATDIIFCDDGNIQSGAIRVIDSSNIEVLVVTFSNCDEFTVTFDGVATVYDQ